MKRIGMLILLACTGLIVKPYSANAQAQELQQLLLDIQKLSSMKSVLSEMKTAYNVISAGYDEVKNVTQGNFSLHDAFINGLLLVNPNIKNYQRVADIIADEGRILSEYKSAFGNFKASGMFNTVEITYMGNVYSNLFNQTLENLDQLTLVLTENSLSMTDDDRLQNIDRIYADMEEKLAFLRTFNRKTNGVLVNRSDLQQTNKTIKGLYGL